MHQLVVSLIPDLVAIPRIAVGVVLVTSAVGKAFDRPHGRDLALPAIEVVIGLGLLAGLFGLAVTTAAGILAVAFLGHALTSRARRCQCFGNRLPSSTKGAQIVRNSMLVLLCVLQVSILVEVRQPLPTLDPILDLGLGVILGVALVILPWVLTWSLGEGLSYG